MKLNSIYTQLLVNTVVPVLLGLLIIGIFSYNNTKKLVQDAQQVEQNFIFNEIKSFAELQMVALSIVEEPITQQLEYASKQLVLDFFKHTKNIENADLHEIREALNLDAKLYDIYIINKDGYVVNTTFKPDLYINLKSFGTAHRNYLDTIFEQDIFHSPRFFFESSTNRPKKYSYQPTLDGKYIIELGAYSSQADQIYEHTNNYLQEISKKRKNLISVDLYFLGEHPHPLNSKQTFFKEHLDVLEAFEWSNHVVRTDNRDKKKPINYNYIYISNDKPALFSGYVLRIVQDMQHDKTLKRTELTKIILALLATLLFVYLLIMFRSKALIKPIQVLTQKTKNIAKGNYRERVEIEGKDEIAQLSRYFNEMVKNIEERNIQIEEQSEFLYKSNRKLNEAYKMLDNQKSLIEHRQDDLTASIDYAHRIQDTLIPGADKFSKLFPDSFVYFIPRNIVSGDFYWHARKNNQIIVVASDCTGHGVPGAFMSMIGMTILHHLVHYENILDPALILSRLDSAICDLLIDKKGEQNRLEGMDVSVCTINTENSTLKYASAKRPIILMRDGEVKTLKGSIYPIGEYYDNIQKIWDTTEIKLQEDDIIYLFSDGYTSQFNENSTKKFNLNRFKQLLSDINKRPLKDQPKVIHRTYEAWKGNAEQVDDIMILGFKFNKQAIKPGISARDIL